MRHKEHKRQGNEPMGMGGVSILTGINMAFYTISSQRERERGSGSGRKMDRGKKKPLLA